MVFANTKFYFICSVVQIFKIMTSFTNIQAPRQLLETLKCGNCLLYLSIPPIMYTQDNKLWCGRCIHKIPKESQTQRATAYENVAQLLLFPCSYVPVGCERKAMKWKSMNQHELSCKFRIYKCPSVPSGSCEWQGRVDSLFQHFRSSHQNLMLDFCQLNLYLLENVEKVFMIVLQEKIFFLKIVTNVQLKKIWYDVFYVMQGENCENVVYRFELKDPECENSIVYYKRTKPLGGVFSERDMLEIHMHLVMCKLNRFNVTCKIAFLCKQDATSGTLEEAKIVTEEPSETSVLDNEISSDFKCPVCDEYMSEPIFICKNGHSICEDCKAKSVVCSTCQASLEGGRNFTLEKMANFIICPCKYENFGCKFFGKPKAISAHHKVCNFKKYNCPLQEYTSCQWKGTLKDHLQHVLNGHQNETQLILRSNVLHDLKLSKSFSILIHDENVFVMYFLFDRKSTEPFFWSFQHVGLDKGHKSPYKVKIKFVDQTNSNRKLVTNGSCYGMVEDDNELKVSAIIPQFMLEPFIDVNNNLIVKYDIRKY